MKDSRSYSAWIRTQKIVRHIVCILLCIMSLFPFYIMFVNATRSSQAIQMGMTLVPSKYFLANWNSLLAKSAGVGTPVWKAILNSATIAVPATLLTVYFSAVTAYGLVVYRFRGRNVAWTFILCVMMIPTQVTVVGFIKFMMKINLYNTYWPLILPAIAAPSVVFFMRQFIQASLPLEILDAARIDGSGEFKTFNTIALPLLKPALATQAIFAFIASWNNLFMPTMMISSQSKSTLPMFVQQLRSEQFRTDYGMIYMGLLVTVIPIFIVYFCLSKYIVAGVALGGVKE